MLCTRKALFLLYLAPACAWPQTPAVEVPGLGLSGYISANIPTAPNGYGYGISFYAPVWPLLQSPIAFFQVGLPSTWIEPDNVAYPKVGQLCPAGTLANQLHWDQQRGGSFQDVFQTIEGSMGYWGSTQEPSGFPKYRMNGTPDCYTTQISSPGWQFGTVTALADNQMGIAQLSNRLLIPPDGVTFDSALGTAINGKLFGAAWMALPLLPQQNFNFQLTTQFQVANNLCLDGNTVGASSPMNGDAYLAPCSNTNDVTWQMIPAAGEYFQLQNITGQAANLCLEGNTGNSGDPQQGYPYMTACNSSPGQLWTLTGTGDWRKLQTKLSQSLNRCLEGSNGSFNSLMQTCSAVTGQLWEVNVQQLGGALPVGDQSWTLFLNTTNFKGPLAFWIPSTWANVGNGYQPALGRTMDFRNGIMGSGAMEVNSVPMQYATDATGTVYTSVPPLQFPVDANGATVLMQDLTMHSSGSIFDPVSAWFQGGAPPRGFNTGAGWIATGCTVNPLSFTQLNSAQDTNTNVPLTGFSTVVETTIFGTGCTWGLQWSGTQETTAAGMAVFPRFYKQTGAQRVVIPPSQVPAATQLTTATFQPAGAPSAYTSPAPGSTSWSSPGPVAGPFESVLADGSTVTYSWYRFVDQPAMQRFPLTASQKAQLQQRIEMMHANWPLTESFMAPPSTGALATLDPALLVTPPPGLEAGYVPIVTRQGPALPASVTPTQGSSQSAPVNTAFGTALQATVRDPAGFPVAGATVTFSAPTSGPAGTFGTASTVMVTTNALGAATAPVFTANGATGSYSVTASVGGVPSPATFSLTNTAGTPGSITAALGSGQSAVINAVFATALQAVVEDADGIPLSGVTVTFTAPTTGPSGTFLGFLIATAVTNASGVATAPAFTANATYGTYTITASAPGTASPAKFSLSNTTGGLAYYPMAPCRVADTRLPVGPFGGPKVAGGTMRDFPIPLSGCQIPPSAQAYSFNITVSPAGALGYLTAWPSGQPQPLVSTLNSPNGTVVANAAIVAAGVTGAVSIYVSNLSDVIIDINGYFAPPGGTGALAFYPSSPCRVADTRTTNGAFGGPSLAADATRNFAIPASSCNIPSDAQAYSLNMTAVPVGPLGYLTTWAAGGAQPLVSTLNAPQSQIVANAAIVPAGSGGAISVFVTDPTNLVIDIDGYFAPPGPGGMYFYPVTPCRVADTRNAAGTFGGPAMGAQSPRGFPIASSSCGIPSTAQAYSLNMTVVPFRSLGYFTTWPAGRAQPNVSTLNDPLGIAIANAAICPAGLGGAINVFATDATHLVIDVNGYFQ